MGKVFNVHIIKGIKLLFIKQGFDTLVIDDNGNFYGGYQSEESAIKMIKKDSVPLCKRELTIRG